MAAPKEKDVDTGTAPSETNTIASILARLVQDQEAGPIKQVHIGKAVLPTAFNPTGSRNRPKLKRAYRMNGNLLREKTLFDEEITLLNKLQPGKYYNNTWVVMQTDGEDDGAKIDIFIPNKTHAQQLENAKASGDGTLGGILRKIVAEQDARA